jgi:hypothetical protein
MRRPAFPDYVRRRGRSVFVEYMKAREKAKSEATQSTPNQFIDDAPMFNKKYLYGTIPLYAKNNTIVPNS